MEQHEIQKMITALEKRRAGYITALGRLNGAIENLTLLVTENGETAEKQKELLQPMPERKAFITKVTKNAIRYKYEALKPVTMAIETIKNEGKPIAAQDLFERFCSLGGYPRANRKRYYPRFYQALMAGVRNQKGLRATPKGTMHGRRLFIDIDPLALSQRAPAPQPEQIADVPRTPPIS